MHKAIWNGEIIAQSENVINISGTTFFPSNIVRSQYLKTSDMSSQDTPFGRINYQDVEVGDNRLEGAAIRYTSIPDDALEKVAIINGQQGKLDYSNYIGFRNGIQVQKD